MNKGKVELMTALLNRIFENNFRFNVFMSQKSESLTHSFFFYCFRSKVIFRVTQKALRDFLNYFRKYLALAEGSAPYSLLPMVTQLMELPKQSCALSPDGRFRYGLPECQKTLGILKPKTEWI